jgi:hypothetical protein
MSGIHLIKRIRFLLIGNVFCLFTLGGFAQVVADTGKINALNHLAET